MINKEATYRAAFENKKNRLKEQTRRREMLLAAAYETNPRLREIDNTMASLGANLAVTALSGDSEKLNEMKKKAQLLTAEKQDILKRAQVPEIEYECSLCSDTGLVSGKICSCIKKEAGNIMLAELSREMPVGSCSFENFNLKYYKDTGDKTAANPKRRMTAILKLCKEYVLGFDGEGSKNLLFMGEAGLGKTHLTMAIVAGVIEKGYLPVYGSADNLFSRIEAEKFSGEGKGAYDTMLNCDLLVIDDLGTEMVTSFTKSVLYNLVNTRLLSRKPTIINTNLTMKEIEEKYTERIASRLIGEYDCNRFLGDDIRQQKLLNK